MTTVIEIRDLWRMPWDQLCRLGRWLGFHVAGGPETTRRRIALIDAVARKIQ